MHATVDVHIIKFNYQYGFDTWLDSLSCRFFILAACFNSIYRIALVNVSVDKLLRHMSHYIMGMKSLCVIVSHPLVSDVPEI